MLLDGVPCQTTTYVSDSELLCLGVEAGQGVHDVQVRVVDPFFVEQMRNKSTTVSASTGLVNEGKLQGGLLRPWFLAVWRQFLVRWVSLSCPPAAERAAASV